MSSILLVDDEKNLREAVTLALEDLGHQIDTAEDGFEALSLVRENKYDLILTDLRMPRMDGLELVRSLQKWNEPTPIIVLSAFATIDSTTRLFKAGVRDLLIKPFELEALHKSVNRVLEESVAARNAPDPLADSEPPKPETIAFLTDTVQALFATIGARDENLSAHSARVACYVLLLAKKLGLNETELLDIEFLALLHDIGKLALPEAVLLKKIRLSESEQEMAKIHPVIGENIISPLKSIPGGDKIIRHHHECFNGQGYPDGLAGQAIPLFSRIIAIADAFDNKLSQTCCDAAAQEKVLGRLRQEAGRQLDPILLETFISVYQTVVLKKSPKV